MTDTKGHVLVVDDDALNRLTEIDVVKAELIKLRYFAGLTIKDAAATLDISPATADRYWTYTRAWLQRELSDLNEPQSE